MSQERPAGRQARPERSDPQADGDVDALPTDLEAARASLVSTRAELDAERQRAADRRDRADARMEALEAELASSKVISARRLEGLNVAKTLLARPLVRVAVRGTRLIDRFRRRPGVTAGPAAAVPTPVSSPSLSGPATRIDEPSIAIHTSPTDRDAAATWGDTHFARGLQRAFERLGWHATVHIATEADDPAAVRADVALHLFGLTAPAVRAGQTSILWIISHPDRVRMGTAGTYDLVLVASDQFAAELARRIDVPVRVMQQATDPDRFHPDPDGPHHELLFIGNSRNARRPILDALAGTGHDLAVYGGRWTPDRLDPRYLRGTWIANDDLHRYYANADIVLNDHWTDMRQEGFVSNRVYDALASGGFVVSDSVPGMATLFDDGVATYASREDLLRVVDRFLSDPVQRHAWAARGRAAVLARHTFDHRAATIVEKLRELGRIGMEHPTGPGGTPPVAGGVR